MKEEISMRKLNKTNIGKSLTMNQNEKTISYLNNYFIYKKIRSPNAKDVSKMMTSAENAQKLGEPDEVSKESLPEKRRVKKYAKKIVLPSK